jgi:5-formaminoimidazole-4-carboxamide-1-beta-D-ribofuranosyl 5'-monophosphate synthetase
MERQYLWSRGGLCVAPEYHRKRIAQASLSSHPSLVILSGAKDLLLASVGISPAQEKQQVLPIGQDDKVRRVWRGIQQ